MRASFSPTRRHAPRPACPVPPLRLKPLAAALSALCALAAPLHARTARDLSARMHVDGYTNDFASDESVFGIDPRSGLPQESGTDSPWANNDLTQMRVTW